MSMLRHDTLPLTQRELDYLVAQRQTRFRPRKFRDIMRVDSKTPAWAERVEIQKIEMKGNVRPAVRGGTDKPPMPTMDRSNGYLSIFEFEAAYEIRYSDLQQAAQLGLGSLPVKLAAANQERAEQILDTIACTGSSSFTSYPTMPGIANNADAVTDKITAAANWDGTVDAYTILGELHSLVDQVYENSKELYTADTVLLPVTTYRFLARQRVGDSTSDTLLGAFLKEAVDVQRVIPWYPLETAGASSVKRGVAFDSNSEEAPRIVIPQEMTDMPPAMKLYGYEVGQTMRTAGVLIENHNTLAYIDGI